MPNNIDERIVEMRFNNKQFESGVSDTIESLDKLKKGLKFDDSIKGFEELDKAAGKVDLNPIERSAQAVKMQFSALEVMAITALSRITNQAIDAGEKLVKSFTIEPIAHGFEQYESRVASVQKIINSSMDNNIDNVTAALDKIEWFTNETSYQFDAMVSALGSFTAAGIPLEKATNTIIGLANAAAISGVNAKDASHAFLGFQRAIGSGSLSLGIWNSYLKTAGFQSQAFIEACIKAGLAVGTLEGSLENAKVAGTNIDVTLSSFAETLSEKWVNSEVITKLSKDFSVASDQLYEIMNPLDGTASKFDTASEAIDELGETLDQYSLKAFKAGQETKTWGDTVEYIRGTVAQTWSKTFEIIFGNYEEARDFFSTIVEDMYTLFVESNDNRNSFLQEWKDSGGQVPFLNGLINSLKIVAHYVSVVRDFIGKLIPPGLPLLLAEITKGFHAWTIEVGQRLGIEKLATSLTKIGKSFEEVEGAAEAGAKGIEGALDGVQKIAEPTAEILEEVNQLAKAVIRGDYGNGAIRVEKLGNKFKAVQNRVNELLGCMYKYEGAWEDWGIGADKATESTEKFSNETEEAGEKLDAFSVIFQNLVSVVKGFKAVFEIVQNALSAVGRFVSSRIFPGLSKLGEGLLGVGGTLGDLFEKVKNFLVSNDIIYKSLVTIYEAIMDKLGPAFKSIGEFLDSLAQRKTDFLEFIESLDFSKIGEVNIQDFFKNLRTSVGNFIQTLGGLGIATGVSIAKFLGFETSTEEVSAVFGSANEKATGFLGTLKLIGGQVGQKVQSTFRGLTEAGKILGKYWEMVLGSEFERTIRNSFIKSGDIFSIFGAKNPIRTFFEAEWSFGKSARVMGAALTEIEEQIPLISNFVRIFTEFKNFFKLIFDTLKAFGKTAIETISKFFGPAVDLIKNTVEKIKAIPFDELLQVGVLVTVMFTLITILKLMKAATSLFKSFTWIGDELYSLLRSAVTRNYAALFLEIAISLGIIMLATAKLAEAYTANSTGVLVAVGIIAGVLGALIGLMLIVKSTATFGGGFKAMQMSSALLMFLGGIGLVIGEIYALAKMPLEDIEKGLRWFITVFAVLGVLLFILNKVVFGEKNNLPTFEKMAGFYAFVLALKTAADILVSLIGYEWNDIVEGIRAMGAIALLLVGLSYTMNKIRLTSSVGLVALIGAIWLFTQYLDRMKNFDYDSMRSTLKKMRPLFVTLGAVAFAAAIVGKSAWGMAALIGSVSLVMNSLVKAVESLGDMNPSALARGVATAILLVGGLLAVATVFADALSKSSLVNFFKLGGGKGSGKDAALTFIGIAGALYLIAGAMKLISTIDPTAMGNAMFVLIPLMGALGYTAKMANGLKASLGAFVGIALAITTIAAMLWVLARVPWEKLMPAATALGGVMAALGWSIAQINSQTVGKGNFIKSIIQVILVLGGAAAALAILAQYNWENIAAASIGLSFVLLTLSYTISKIKPSQAKFGNVMKGLLPMIGALIVAAGALSLLVWATKGATWEQILAAAAGLSAVLLALGYTFKAILSVSSGLSLISSEIDGFIIFVGKLGLLIVAIGAVVAALHTDLVFATGTINIADTIFGGLIYLAEKIGEFISAFGEGLTSRLPKMGEDLGAFATDVIPFAKLMGDSSIDWNNISSAAGSVAAAIMELGKASWQSFDAEKTKTKMEVLAGALKTFYTEIQGSDIKPYQAKAAAEAVSTLAGVTFPDNVWLGNDNWSALAENFKHMGAALKSFSDTISVEDFDIAAVQSGLDLVQQLSDIATKTDLSKFSGWDALIGWTPPEKDISGYGGMPSYIESILPTPETITSLGRVVDSFVQISDIVTGKKIDFDAINLMLAGVDSLVDVAKKVPEAGGKVQEWFGEFSWETLSKGLVSLGSKFLVFGNYGASLNQEGFTAMIGALTEFGECLSTFPPFKPGLWQWLSGDNSLKGFADTLPLLGEKLAAFVTCTEGITQAQIIPSLNLLRQICKIPSILEEEGSDLSNFSLLDAGYHLEEFTRHFVEAVSNLYGIVGAGGEDAVDQASIFSKIQDLFTNVQSLFTEDTIEQLKTVGEQLSGAITEGFATDTTDLLVGADGFVNNLMLHLSDEKLVYPRFVATGHIFARKLAIAFSDKESMALITAVCNEVVLKIYNSIHSLINYNRMKQAGEYLIDGLIAGMEAKRGDIEKKARELAEAANKAFMGAEHMSSPSKLWRKYGEYLVAGLTVGMDSSADEAVSSARYLAAALNGEFSNATASITPVVDLNGVGNKANQLNRMFDSSRAAAISANMQINSQVTQFDQLVDVTNRILGSIQNGSDLYLDDNILAGRINRRLGVL